MKTYSTQLLSRISILCSIVFITLLAILHLIKNDVNPFWQPISEYALGKNGWVMRFAFFSMTIATGAAAVVSFKLYKKSSGKIGSILLAISSIGFLLAGIYNTDPSTTSNENMTTTGTIHSVGAGFSGMIVFASLFFFWQVYKNPIYRELRNPVAYATVLLWISEIILMISMAIYLPKNDGNLGPEVFIGLQGRFMIICAAIWIVIFMKQTMRIKEM